MKQPKLRRIFFHGDLAERYSKEPIEIAADSMTILLRILFKNIFPNFLDNEKHFVVIFEDSNGNFTELFDQEQVLSEEQVAIHIVPNPDGAWVQFVYAIIVAIVAVGVALLLAPKLDFDQDTASGANWQSPENVIGQGGVAPVLLGTRLTGSRVVSHGIDSNLYVS